MSNADPSGGHRITADALARFIVAAYEAAGVPHQDAVAAASLMMEADLVGADAHGIFRLPQYVERIKAGDLNPGLEITVTRTAPATARIDGDNGLDNTLPPGRHYARGNALGRRG